MTLKSRVTEAMKDAMRAKDKERLGAIRLILADVKRIEVDERVEVDDNRMLVIMDKMLKQRKDSIDQFKAAGRDDLIKIEEYEVGIIKEFMPEPISADELARLITQAIASTGAASVKDMGKVMAELKPLLQGRADVGQVSASVKALLQVSV
jgi:uncharacterized protein YqeY